MSDEDVSARPAPSDAAALASARDPILEATELAWRWHGDQRRKGRTTSYMSHLLQVAGLVIDAGGGASETIAALLHDALEDAVDPADRARRTETIERRFGRDVLAIVLDLTDTTPAEAGDRKGPWRERKERYLAQLRRAPATSRLVAACDKRQNLGDLVSDLHAEGFRTLERFNAGPDEQLWYFESLVAICREGTPPKLANELDRLVADLRSLLRS